MQDSRKNRLENFSDGVMAIAITLLALEIPHITPTITDTIYQQLRTLIPGILTFLLSFMTIAIFWVNHHQLTQHIDRIKRRVTWATMLFLFFMTLIPFASRMLFENWTTVFGVMVYGAVLFCGSIMFTVLHTLVHKKQELTRTSRVRSVVGPVLYAFAISVAPLSLFAAYGALILAPLFYFLPHNHE